MMPAQVADAVAVGVGEAARVDLVDDGALPPRRASGDQISSRRGGLAPARETVTAAQASARSTAGRTCSMPAARSAARAVGAAEQAGVEQTGDQPGHERVTGARPCRRRVHGGGRPALDRHAVDGDDRALTAAGHDDDGGPEPPQRRIDLGDRRRRRTATATSSSLALTTSLSAMSCSIVAAHVLAAGPSARAGRWGRRTPWRRRGPRSTASADRRCARARASPRCEPVWTCVDAVRRRPAGTSQLEVEVVGRRAGGVQRGLGHRGRLPPVRLPGASSTALAARGGRRCSAPALVGADARARGRPGARAGPGRGRRWPGCRRRARRRRRRGCGPTSTSASPTTSVRTVAHVATSLGVLPE